METVGVKLITVSPYTSRSNGLVERTIQTVKSCLSKSHQTGQTLFDVLKTLRATPIGNGLPAPSVLLQSRNLRSSLNFTPAQLRLQLIDHKRVEDALRFRQSLMNNNATKPADLKFVEGMHVWVNTGRRQWAKGKVMGRAQTPRSYLVEVDGTVYRRNQSALRIRNLNLQTKESRLNHFMGGFSSIKPTSREVNDPSRELGADNEFGASKASETQVTNTRIRPSDPGQLNPSTAPANFRRSERDRKPVEKLNYSKLGGS